MKTYGLILFVLYAYFASLAGWVLSGFGRLSAFGYVSAAIVFVSVCLAFSHRKAGKPEKTAPRGYFLKPRFFCGVNVLKPGTLLPLLWLALLCLILLGGFLHPPNNYDYLTYRLPRILHWQHEGGWHWITTNNNRMNISGSGMEWMFTPLFLWSLSDRMFFAVNSMAFAFMPGLVFSIGVKAGLSPRISWYWMWLLPMSFCYAVQAGGTGNDMTGVFFALAALHFSLDYWKNPQPRTLFLCLICSAILTNIKASNLPLVLPVLVPVLLRIKELLRMWKQAVVCGLAAAPVSFLPHLILNVMYSSHWTGDPGNESRMRLANPLFALLGNMLQVLAGLFQPPLLPFASGWNRLAESWVDGSRLREAFPRVSLDVKEIPNEETAGLGMVFLLSLLLFSFCVKRRPETEGPIKMRGQNKLRRYFTGAVLAATLTYLSKMGSEGGARILAPYYPFLLFAGLLWFKRMSLTRKFYHPWSACIGLLIFLSSAIPVILTPSRPLLPIQRIIEAMPCAYRQSALVSRTRTVYNTYSRRSDLFAGVREVLADDVNQIVFLGSPDDSEVSLWRPFGRRTVSHFPELGEATVLFFRDDLRDRVSDKLNLREWETLQTFDITSKVQEGSVTWHLKQRIVNGPVGQAAGLKDTANQYE